MYIIENTTEFQLDGSSAVAIGKFDGIHLGHQKLIHKIIEQKEKGRLATVFTFDTSASAFFAGEEKELTVKAEKRAIFEAMGVDVIIEFPLNQETAATEPAEFVHRYLVKQMRTAYICAGTDLSFGRKGAGNYELLQQYADAYGYQVELIDKVKMDGEDVSSTRVRDAVRAGRMEEVTKMLGVPYSVSGIVEHGKRLGRTIGMPTANLLPDQDKLLPPNGVYYSQVILGGTSYRSISNIGCKPTVSDRKIMGVETYLYDFEGDIYGRDITVQLLAFRRAEIKFDGVESLKAQMEKDIEAGRSYGIQAGSVSTE
ncbi:MAG: bifunctional riboflavin kinase/FAD synthetase [Lachnospiraceae bacterium]|nr:bifunctional riboflavin kinase/FAD synthetase [Lachnospiraceae bacterium]